MADERKDHLWKVQEADERMEDLVSGANPVGLDVGTSKVVSARKKGKGVETATQLNAFIPVPYSRFTENILGQNDISYYREGDELIIYGTATERFANMFNADIRRPMADGVLNPARRRPWACWRRSSRACSPAPSPRARSSRSPCPPWTASPRS
jgi:hypothetical protein